MSTTDRAALMARDLERLNAAIRAENADRAEQFALAGEVEDDWQDD